MVLEDLLKEKGKPVALAAITIAHARHKHGRCRRLLLWARAGFLEKSGAKKTIWARTLCCTVLAPTR